MAVEVALVAEAGRKRDLGQRLRALREHGCGAVQPRRAMIFARRAAQETAECPGQMNRMNVEGAAERREIEALAVAQALAARVQPARRAARRHDAGREPDQLATEA